MEILALFFTVVKMFSFMYSRQLAYFAQNFALMLQARRKNPDKRQVLLVDKSAMIFIVYFIADILFLLYCILLMLDDATWQPGCLLLLISALESFALHFRIDGTYSVDKAGLAYPKMWFKYLMTGQSLFILLKLMQ